MKIKLKIGIYSTRGLLFPPHLSNHALRNQDRFYKDRHWMWHDFPELQDAKDREVNLLLFDVHSSGKAVLLELGCGVGNTLFPLLEVFLELSSQS